MINKQLLLLSGLLLIAGNSTAVEEIAVIGTRSETLLTDLPGNISVLDSNALKILSAVHIQQVLSHVPGVNYHRGNGQESLPAIRSAVLTGAGACGNILVLEDAIPVRGAGFCNVNELFDTHYEQANSIEVVRGANTAFYGSNAMLGSVNVNLAAYGENRLAIELGENQYRRIKLAANYGDPEEQHGRLYLTLSDDGGFRDQSGYQQQKLSWRHVTTLGDWSVKLGATATALDQQTAGFIVGADSYRDAELRKQNLDPEAFRKTEAVRAWASFSKSLDGQRSLTITPYVRLTDMDFLQHFLPGDPLEQNQQHGFGWQSSLTTKVSDQLQWSVGIDGEVSSGELLQTQEKPTQGSAFLVATIPTGTHYDYQVDTRQFGIFGHVTWRLTERIKAIAGLRFESVRYDYDNRGLTGRTRDDGTECGFGGCRYSRPADSKDDFNHLSPKLELQYQASEHWRWHLSVADAFRAPQATELYRLQRAQIIADLDEVRATHLELGANWRNDNSQLAINLYQIQQRNVIIRDSDFFSVDGQRIDSHGIEVDLQHAFNEQWSARLVAAYARHQYASDQISGGVNINGNEVDTAPNFVGSVVLSWQISANVRSELEIQKLSSYYLDPENAHKYPGHSLLNLRTNYQFNDRWSASLRLLNLGNRSYAERADFTSFTDERYFPGEPRSIFGEISWQF